MIVINNVSIHYNARIKKLIILYEYKIRYLFSYSSNFNLIELSFNVLKIWIRKHFHEIWFSFDDFFDEFLHYAVTKSHCDWFSKQHFKHNVGDYIFEADIKALKKELKTGSIDFDSI